MVTMITVHCEKLYTIVLINDIPALIKKYIKAMKTNVSEIFSVRNKAIDILRALTMLLMIFVNDLWSINNYPEWLGHAESGQDMLGLADIVFPCFLFVVGMSIPYAIESRFAKGVDAVDTVAHILTRTLALLVMGVYIVNTEYGISPNLGISFNVYRILMIAAFFMIWNVYPKTDKRGLRYTFSAIKITGLLLLIFLGIIFKDYNGEALSPRWWGILGIIGWTYLISAFIYLFTRDRLKYLILIYAFLITICLLQTPLIDGRAILFLPDGNFFNAMLSILHIDNGAILAFTMGGIILSIISTKYKDIKNSQKTIFIIVLVLILIAAGFITHKYWIISKLGATPPWLFYCTGIAIISYSIIYWLDSIGKTYWAKFIKPAGTATLTCYLVPYVLYALRFIESPDWFRNGFPGIINCIIFSFFTIGITYILGRIHIKLKI